MFAASLPAKPPALVDAEKALESLNTRLTALHREQSGLDAATARFLGKRSSRPTALTA